MRVALVSYYFPEYTISLANALSAQGIQTFLSLPRQSVEPIRRIISPDVRLRAFRGCRLRDPVSAWEVYKLVQMIRTWEPDLIHIQQGHLWFNLVGLPLLWQRQIVTTVHDVISHEGDVYSRKTPQWVWDIALKRASRLIVHGEALKQQVTRKHNIPLNRVHVIPHGEFTLYTRWSKPDLEEQNSILFFGRLWPYKGLQYLIQAEPLITAQVPSAKIIIAGEGEDFTQYQGMMVNKDRFEIHNRFIPVEEVASLFQRAGLVVLPYIEASQSGVIPLAYAFGKPVVATCVGSIPEIVDHGETGYTVPPRDVDRLAEAVVTLLRNPELRRQMGQNAFRKAHTELSWEKIATETRKVYTAALDD